MRLLRNLRLSVRALSTHRVRTGLAVAGTAVGVSGVLVLTAIGEGARGEVLRRIERFGPNVLLVMATNVDARAGRSRQGVVISRDLRAADAEALVHADAGVRRAAPAHDRDMPAKFGPIQTMASVLGTTPEWLEIRQFRVTEGRFFSSQERDARARVAVIGSDIRKNLFPDTVDPLGRIIRVGRVPFTVVGVLASSGTSVTGASSEDNRIVVPLETALRRLFNVEHIETIYLQTDRVTALEAAGREAASILRFRHNERPDARDDFTIQNQRTVLAAELAAQSAFQRLIMGLGFLSLVVGGAGILSILLLSVRERRHEIGLRMAVGARRHDIATQFLSEALILAGTGGLIGIGVGAALTAIVSATTRWEAQVSALSLYVALASAVAIGVCSGLLPARRAAALDPIDSLQSG